MGPRFIAVTTIAAFSLLAGTAAHADESGGSSSDVYERLRPEYDANGLHVGTFFLYPSMSSGGGLNSNIYNAPIATSDYFYSIDTAVKFQSGWSRHELELNARTKSVWFSNQITENRMDWDVRADLRLDLIRGTKLGVKGDYALAHEERGTGNAGGAGANDADALTEFNSNNLDIEFEHSFNRLKLTLSGDWQRLDFLDGQTIAVPSAVIDNDDRDRTAMRYSGKTALEVWSDTAIFLRGTMVGTDYAAPLHVSDLNRDSSEYIFDGGLEFSISHLLVGQIAAGMSQKTFTDTRLPDSSSAAVDLHIKWYPSMLTNVTVSGGRSTEETSVAGSSGYISTRGGVSMDHELLRNLILTGKLSYENDEYAQTLRNDDVLTGAVSGRYMINNQFHLDAGYEFVDRSSSDAPFAYSASQFQLSLTGKM